MTFLRLAVFFTFLVSSACGGWKPPAVPETVAIADNLDKALDNADALMRPYKAAVEVACLNSMDEVCGRARVASAAADLSIGEARTKVDQYRESAAIFWRASDAVNVALNACAEFMETAKDFRRK